MSDRRQGRGVPPGRRDPLGDHMKASWLGGLCLVAAVAVLNTDDAPSPAAPDYKKIKAGPLSSIEYWRAKAVITSVEEALKTGQPRASVEFAARSFLNSIDDLTEMFPVHEDIPKWQ